MGYDLYGLNPRNPGELKKPKAPNWKTASKSEKEHYFFMYDEYKMGVPGYYFRNNVWYWSPLWEFVCLSCEDILDQEDIEKGWHNGGEEISEDKAEMIADRLFLLLKNKIVHKYQVKRESGLKQLPFIECNICEGTGYRAEPPKVGKGKSKCNGCNTEMHEENGIPPGKQRQWTTQYPFDSDNVLEFARFCSNSGGFEIG